MELTSIFFWGFLFLYGITMIFLSPKALTIKSFFMVKIVTAISLLNLY